MLKKIIKGLFFALGYQIVLQASIFIPKSPILKEMVDRVLVKELMPSYIEKYVIDTKNLNSKNSLQDNLLKYKEQFQTLKVNSVMNVEKMFIESKDSFYENNELNSLLQDLKRKQTLSDIKTSLEKEYVSSLSKLGLLHPETITTEALRKEFSHYLVNKKDIDPVYSCFTNVQTRDFFKTLLENIPQENITNISSISPRDTDPIKMPAANRAKTESNTYEILLSHKRSDADTFFGLAHELGHVLNLDSHRIGKAGQKCFNESICRRILHFNKIDSYMACLYRSREFIADTEVIMQLATTNLPLAIELCEHGINSCTNHIALDTIKYMGSGDSGPISTLTSHDTNDHHPTWQARLFVLLKIYEGLQS
ncbi:MAG TPA: hypothetical protein VL201_05535 [Patescibacteria group bacterium]|jgi:hypothetical protein|nr:hypothetical protein [Patescibacteria group bacterium]